MGKFEYSNDKTHMKEHLYKENKTGSKTEVTERKYHNWFSKALRFERYGVNQASPTPKIISQFCNQSVRIT